MPKPTREEIKAATERYQECANAINEGVMSADQFKGFLKVDPLVGQVHNTAMAYKENMAAEILPIEPDDLKLVLKAYEDNIKRHVSGTKDSVGAEKQDTTINVDRLLGRRGAAADAAAAGKGGRS